MPSAKVTVNQDKDKIAAHLFGTNYSHQYGTQLTYDPLIVLCKDDINEQSIGTEIDGLSVRLCNKTNNVQTDVGVCIASDPTMILNERKIVTQTSSIHFSDGLRNVEHLMVINVNKLGSVDDFKVR